MDDPKILENPKEIKIDTPFGKTSDVLLSGQIAGKDVVILARHGKKHRIIPGKVPYRANIWALKEAGCDCILAATACGSLREEIRPKDFVFVDQFIDFTRHRVSTFFEEKVIHTPMGEPFCPELRKLLMETADELNISYHKKGVNITIEGPRFSTRAESHMFRGWGADVINMTTCPETALARELDICYASIAMATDYDCWREDTESVTMEMVLEAMEDNAENAKKLLVAVIPKINFDKCS